ncbi:MAG: membrane integrity-associated transporter subunit PqiC [Coxiellaceae bacterium]|nr:membrane integrity-associated transporter subunit PqiC [Coxiellaceae bacterium]
MLVRIATIVVISLFLTGCFGPVKSPTVQTFTINSRPYINSVHRNKRITVMVTTPTASPGYETSQMIYNKQRYELNHFTKNKWAGPPAEMLNPLLVQALQDTGYFHAVVSTPISVDRNLRIKTNLLELRQDFTVTPSRLRMAIQVDLVNDETNKVINSRVFSTSIPTLCDTPYGGVIAANRASQALMRQIAYFTVDNLVGRRRQHAATEQPKATTAMKLPEMIELPAPVISLTPAPLA